MLYVCRVVILFQQHQHSQMTQCIVFYLLQDVTGIRGNDVTDDVFHTVHVPGSILGDQNVARGGQM